MKMNSCALHRNDVYSLHGERRRNRRVPIKHYCGVFQMNNESVRKCVYCKIEKPFSEFPKDKTRKYGIGYRCVSCCKIYYDKSIPRIREHSKKYYQEHKEEDKKRCAEYRKRNIDHCKARDMEYHYKHRNERNEKANKYYHNNKEVFSEYSKAYRAKNHDTIIEKKKKYYDENKEAILLNYKKYAKKHRKDLNKYATERRRSNISIRISDNIRKRCSFAIKKAGGNKSSKSEYLLGCSFEDARKYLESKFQPGMSWENHGKWHIDHIRPCASFDLTDPDQQKECFHYTNLQPLWAKDNFIKNSKYNGKTHRFNKCEKQITG